MWASFQPLYLLFGSPLRCLVVTLLVVPSFIFLFEFTLEPVCATAALQGSYFQVSVAPCQALADTLEGLQYGKMIQVGASKAGFCD
jgi:hypothetical protein